MMEMSITGKDYIELLEKKNFRLDDITFDTYSENNVIQELNIYKTYKSKNNSKVSAEITLCCEDIDAFNREGIIYDEDRLYDSVDYRRRIDKDINYDLFDCASVNVYGEAMVGGSLDVEYTGEEFRGIGLKNKKYFKYNTEPSPIYELSLENLEQVLYIQDCQDKTPHINFLLQNYLFYYSKIIEPIINPIMEYLGAVGKCNINLDIGTENDVGIVDNEIKLTYIKDCIELGGYSEVELFSVFVDLLYGNLYGIIQVDDDIEVGVNKFKYINLTEITKEKLIEELKTDNMIKEHCNDKL